MKSLLNYLKQFPNFSEEKSNEVASHISTKKYEEGEYFLREGQICRNIAFIETGMMRVVYLKDGISKIRSLAIILWK